MVNTAPAKYTVQIGPTLTPEVAGELAAWAEWQQVSAGVTARDCIDEGLARLRSAWEQTYGALPEQLLSKHVRAARVRGDRQVARRRAYDERTRRGETTMAATRAAASASGTARRPKSRKQAAGEVAGAAAGA